jgi:hypothetical protein
MSKNIIFGLITPSIEKANTLNSYYPSIFRCEPSIPKTHIYPPNSDEPFAVTTKRVRKWLAAIGKSKSIGPDGVYGESLKLAGEAMIPYLARLLDITINNASIPSDWKEVIVVPIYRGGNRSLVVNHRPISLTSVVCKQMEHVIVKHLRKIWYKNDK